MDEHHEWLATHAAPDETLKAFEFELGRYFAGERPGRGRVLRAHLPPRQRPRRGPTSAPRCCRWRRSRTTCASRITFADAVIPPGLGRDHASAGCWRLRRGSSRSSSKRRASSPSQTQRARRTRPCRGASTQTLARRDRCRVEEIVDGTTGATWCTTSAAAREAHRSESCFSGETSLRSRGLRSKLGR